jgi:hypothetical protein
LWKSNGTKMPYPDLGSVVPLVTLRLVTIGRIRFWTRVPKGFVFLLGYDFPAVFEPQVVLFRGRQNWAARRNFQLIQGKAIVASVQQFATLNVVRMVELDASY